MVPERPPLAAWPERAFPHEGAHGWFQRLAKANGQISARTLAELLGVNGRDPQPNELLELSRRFPVQGGNSLELATPMIDGSLVILQGQSFSLGRDFSFSQPRICPACVAEERFYRSWFDIQAIDCCPVHGLRLTRGLSGDFLAWWYPEIGITPGGTDLSRLGSDSAGERERAWADFVLGRLGIVPACVIPWLADSPLHVLIDVSTVLGRLAISQADGPKRHSHCGRALYGGLGFELLKGGQRAVASFIESQAADATVRFFGKWGLYERTLAPLEALTGDPVADYCRSALNAAYRKRASRFRRRAGAALGDGRGPFTLIAAAAILQLQPARLRHVAVRLGVVEPVNSNADVYAFSKFDLERIGEVLRTSVVREDAARALGLSANDMGPLIAAGELSRLARIGGRGRSFDRFMPEEIGLALARWRSSAVQTTGRGLSFAEFCSRTGKSPGRVALEIVRGERKIVSWPVGLGFLASTVATDDADHVLQGVRTRRSRSWNGVSIADAAARLALAPRAVRELENAGELRVLPGENGLMPGVCPDSLRAFEQTYASARLYANLLGVPVAQVRTTFREAGVTRLDGVGLEKMCIVRRSDVTARVGRDWNLEQSANGVGERFWAALKGTLRAAGSTNRVVGGVGCNATIRSGDAKLVAEVHINPTRSSIELSLSSDRRRSPSRYQRMLECLPLLGETWAKATSSVDLSVGVISFCERFAYSGGLSPEQAHQIARQIDARLTLVRHQLNVARLQLAAA